MLRKEITAHIRWLEQRLTERDEDLNRMRRSSPLWRERANLLLILNAIPKTRTPWSDRAATQNC